MRWVKQSKDNSMAAWDSPTSRKEICHSVRSFSAQSWIHLSWPWTSISTETTAILGFCFRSFLGPQTKSSQWSSQFSFSSSVWVTLWALLLQWRTHYGLSHSGPLQIGMAWRWEGEREGLKTTERLSWERAAKLEMMDEKRTKSFSDDLNLFCPEKP